MTTIEKRAKIKALQSELDGYKAQVSAEVERCRREGHQWQGPKFDPVIKKRAVYSHIEPRGSDPETVYNYVDEEVPRWSRICSKCGHIEYTDKKRTVVTAPDFGG